MKERIAVRRDLELAFGDGRQDAALQPHHGADEGIHQHQQRELAQVLAQAEADGRGLPHQGASPRLKRSMASMAAGLGEACPTAVMNASRPSDSRGFQRFSKPRVDEGLPDKPAPHRLPA
jgi:hypothetical protein